MHCFPAWIGQSATPSVSKAMTPLPLMVRPTTQNRHNCPLSKEKTTEHARHRPRIGSAARGRTHATQRANALHVILCCLNDKGACLCSCRACHACHTPCTLLLCRTDARSCHELRHTANRKYQLAQSCPNLDPQSTCSHSPLPTTAQPYPIAAACVRADMVEPTS